MFGIAGIMADEEPKTPVTPSGDINIAFMGNGTNQDHYPLSSPLFMGSTEGSISVWATPISSGGSQIYEEYIDGSYGYIELSNTNFVIVLPTTGMTETIIYYDFALPRPPSEMHHFVATWSLIDNAWHVYEDGVLVNSGVVSYGVKVGSTTQEFRNNDYSISTFSSYNSALTQEDVDELYIYDEDLLFAGARGFDSLPTTGNIIDNLNYFVSFTEGVSIAGNEFSDKVSLGGSPITISNTNIITFDQDSLYVYTNEADLPSGTPTIYPVSASSFDGTGSTFYRASHVIAKGAPCFSMVADIYLPTIEASVKTIFGESFNTSGTARFYFATNGPTITINVLTNEGSATSYSSGLDLVVGHNKVGVTRSFDKNGVGTDEIKFYVNGNITTVAGSPTASKIYDLDAHAVPSSIGALMYTNAGAHWLNFEGDIAFIRASFSEVLSDVEMSALMTTPANCLGSIDSAITNKLDFATDCATYTGSVGATVDQIGTNDLTEVGTVAYVDNGLEVGC